MSRNIPASFIAAFDSAVFRPLVLVEIDFPSNPLRFSSAYDQIDVNGVTYLGAGNLGKVSKTGENNSLEPAQIEISLSGVNRATLDAIGGTNYLNQNVRVDLALLNEDGTLVDGGATMSRFRGKTDEVSFEFGSKAKIRIVARDQLADWSRPRVERNINSDQQAKYPGDVGMEFVAQASDKELIWPKRAYFEQR